MNIILQKPFSISEIGRRVNNEDAIYPTNGEVSVDDRLFLVCDGVGGANKGEVASTVACESIKTYFNSFLDSAEINPIFIEKAIRYTEIRFDDYIKENPEAQGMATTICMLYIATDGIYIMHAGDSRIYHVRDGKIIFQTEDHSLVNSLIRTGQIDKEKASVHPQKNVIYRAIQGSNHPIEVEVVKIEDILQGDQFFMCTDGIIEALTDGQICEILNNKETSETKLTQIKLYCTEKAKDNYSAYLIPIQDVQDSKSFKQIFASFLYAFM